MALETPPRAATPPPDRPPVRPTATPPRTGRVVGAVVATMAAVVVIAVVGFVLLNRTSKPAAPVGLHVITTTAASVTIGWRTGSSETPPGYYVYRDGTRVTSVAGSTRDYRDTGLRAGAAYTYQVSAYANGVESNRSSELIATTPTDMSLAASRLGGLYDVRLQVTAASGYPNVRKGETDTLEWSFTPASRDVTSVDGESWAGSDWTISLARSGATYAGRAAQSDETCFATPVRTTVRVAITVRAADVVDADWTATHFTGTLTQVAASTVSGGEDCPGARFTGSVVGRLRG